MRRCLKMIDGKQVLGIIPARGGSKGLPRKNILPLAGKPLIAWTIEAGLASRYIDRLIVSTDDEEIARVARTWGAEVPFMRPAELAQDHTGTIEVVRHVLRLLPGYDVVVVLQPTSPLRRAEDIDGCLEMMVKRRADTCVSLTESACVPEWMYRFDEHGRLRPVLDHGTKVIRRQDSGKTYILNGAVYAGLRQAFLARETLVDREDTVGYVMPRECSIDVDELLDLKICEWLIQERGAY